MKAHELRGAILRNEPRQVEDTTVAPDDEAEVWVVKTRLQRKCPKDGVYRLKLYETFRAKDPVKGRAGPSEMIKAEKRCNVCGYNEQVKVLV